LPRRSGLINGGTTEERFPNQNILDKHFIFSHFQTGFLLESGE